MNKIDHLRFCLLVPLIASAALVLSGCDDPKPSASADQQMREGLEARKVKPMSAETRKAMEEAMAKNQNPQAPGKPK